MPDVLTAIDRALAGTCPCGADPRPGSPYCSADCEPTYRSDDTTSDYDGTAMRWRPDLVTEDPEPDSLDLINDWRRGAFRARSYQDLQSARRFYLRLDDGNRYVGLYVDCAEIAEEDGLEPTWQRLERELTDRRRLDPDPADPWADVFQTGSVFIAPVGTSPAALESWHHLGEAASVHWRLSPEQVESIRLSFDNAAASFRRLADAASRLAPAVRALRDAAAPPEPQELDHPLARVNAQRRDRTYGPPRTARPPRQIGPGQ